MEKASQHDRLSSTITEEESSPNYLSIHLSIQTFAEPTWIPTLLQVLGTQLSIWAIKVNAFIGLEVL
jgi:hypothetical protein